MMVTFSQQLYHFCNNGNIFATMVTFLQRLHLHAVLLSKVYRRIVIDDFLLISNSYFCCTSGSIFISYDSAMYLHTVFLSKVSKRICYHLAFHAYQRLSRYWILVYLYGYKSHIHDHIFVMAPLRSLLNVTFTPRWKNIYASMAAFTPRW